jgi:CHAT domain-containing protein/tetratricopeptide (TPR) repeat protein
MRPLPLLALLTALLLPAALAANPLCEGALDKTSCEAQCAELPATPTCMVTRRFGAPGIKAWRAILASQAAPIPLTPLQAAHAQGMSPADARAFTWYLHGAGMVPYPDLPAPLQNPSPAQLDVVSRQQARCATLQDAAWLDCQRALIRALTAAYGEDERVVPELVALGAALLEDASLNEEGFAAYERALAIVERRYPAGHPRRLFLMSWLAAHAFDAHDYERALRYDATLLAQHTALYGKDHPLTTAILAQHAMLRMETGELDMARAAVERLVEAETLTQGPDHPRTALAIYQYGRLLTRQGDARSALEAYKRAAIIYHRARPDDPMMVILLNDMGMALARTGQIKEAREAFQSALGRVQQLKPLPIGQLATIVNNLGELDALEGDLEQAMKWYAVARDARIKVFGPAHPEVAYARLRISDVLWRQGKIALAVTEREQALAVLRAARLPADHADLIDGANALAVGYWALGREDEARKLQLEALGRFERRIPAVAAAAWSDIQLLNLLGQARFMIGRALTYFAAPADAPRVLDVLLTWQGLGARIEQLKRAPAPAAPPAARGLVLSAKPKAQPTPAIAYTSPGHDALCKALGARDEVMVLYVLSEQIEGKGADAAPVATPRYDALVVQPQGCAIARVGLGPAQAIHDASAAWRKTVDAAERCYAKHASAALCQPSMKAMDAAAARLAALVWAPVAARLGEGRRVALVPDGALGAVAFGALVDARGRYLVEDWTFTEWAWPAALIERGARAPQKSAGALVVGDLNYAAQASGPLVAQRCDASGCAEAAPQQTPAVALRAGGELCGYEASWGRLVTEAPQVARALGASGVDTTLVTGDQATQRALLAAMPGKRFIHLATHGFASTPDACADNAPPRSPGFQPEQLTTPRVDPLRLSALVLSGANVADRRAASEDGVLSAREIAGLDLSGVELVALSACQTGLGELREGEGTLGLARSFLVAGAGAVIASMWQVPGAPTTALLNDLYARMVAARPASAEDALADAQRAAIATARAQGAPHSALLWGAFVVFGSTRR